MVLFWTFHIWYKIMGNPCCYLFPTLCLFHCSTQVSTNFTFISETSPLLLLLKCLPWNAKKELLVKIVEHEIQEAFFDCTRGYVQLERFILLRVTIFQQFPRLTSLYFFLVFSNDCWNLTSILVDNSQVVLTNQTILKTGKYSLANNKLQSTLFSIFTLVTYPLFVVASIECPDFTTLTGKNTYCTILSLCNSSRLGHYLYMEAASRHRLGSIFLNKN